MSLKLYFTHFVLPLLTISVSTSSKPNATDFDIRQLAQIQGSLYASTGELILGDHEVCNIFRDFLQNKLEPEVQEKNKDWLMKMLDSWGKLPSGLLLGTLTDYGNFDECLAVQGVNTQVEGKYCYRGLEILNTLNIAVCIPKECDLAQPGTTKKGALIETNPMFCQTNDTYSKFTIGGIIVTCIFGVVAVIMTLSTLYDCYLQYTNQETRWMLLIAFSVLTNGKKLFTMNFNPSGQISCLNGIRTISLMWIIAGHSFAFQRSFPVTNALNMLEFASSKRANYIHVARFAVDTFFFLSAFLLSYNYFKGIEKEKLKSEKSAKNPQNPLSVSKIPMFYIHRLLRIMPPLAALYAIETTLTDHFTSGPNSPFIPTVLPNECFANWWSFFLFIQNYVHYDKMCILTTWYLSADMQMFLASPIMIIPAGEFLLRGKKKIGYIFTAAVILLCIIYPMVADLVDEENILNQYSTHPRLGIYTLGILFGMIVNECTNKKIKVNNILNVALWILAIGIMLVIFFTYMDATFLDTTPTTTTLYLTFTRPAWGLALCWIIFACQFGYGGPINWFLSHPINQIMTRLSFSMYLLHASVITALFRNVRTPAHFSEYEIMYRWCGDFIFSIVISTLWVLAFESPVVVLEKVIFGRGGSTNSKPNGEINPGPENKTIAQQA